MAQEFVAGDRIVNNASSVLFRRLPYFLSPQFDLYEYLKPFVREKSVLEIGFGTGIGCLNYARSAAHVDAIEIDLAAVRFANRCFRLPNVAWIHSSVEDITTPNDFDFVVMIEVLEHVVNAELALEKVSGALKPQGYALITVPNKNRERKKDDPLIENEWDAYSFRQFLLEHFSNAHYLDFQLRELTGTPDIKATPLIALCS